MKIKLNSYIISSSSVDDNRELIENDIITNGVKLEEKVIEE